MGKKFIPIILVLAAMFCTLPMRGDSPSDAKVVISIRQVGKQPTVRDLTILPLQACYDGVMYSIHTVVTSDLGEVDLTVTNLMTGESWWTTFDSGETSQSLLPISGSPGYYEIEYITESGDVYVGEFLIE